jgi:hypothetical protein
MLPHPLSSRIANYNINVTLDAQAKTLSGQEILIWRNDSNDYINDLQFHLYLNAFRDENSTFMQEVHKRHRYIRMENSEDWGWIDVTGMRILNGEDLFANLEYIQPDDGNPDDQTVLRVILPRPVEPQQVIQLEIEFEAKLPRIFARTGYKGNFFMVGQWFPKIGVYEEAGERFATNGQWNCHQFHANSEFYADYGIYDVKITLPQEYIVGATGVLISEVLNEDGTKTHNYYCEDVHDFAWTADTDYIIIEDQWEHVQIIYLVQPLRAWQGQRQIQAVKHALEYCREWCGPYPYPTLTIVDPQYRAIEAGGMEYPTLITGRMSWLTPASLKLAESVVVHEFCHNYWYGIIASNESEEAWLDEGMTTYAELKIMETYYGIDEGSLLSIFGTDIYLSQFEWTRYACQPQLDIIFKNSWQYERGGYGTFSYSKPAMMLLTLENFLGREMMKKVMRSYYQRYKFKHPTTLDFVTTVNDVSGQDLNWFFDKVLYTSEVLDYKIDQIFSKQIKKDEVPQYDNQVVVARAGEIIFPVEVLIVFDDGHQVTERWNGEERFKIFNYENDHKLVSAQVDPERKVWLDVNFLNNGKTIVKNNSTIIKYSARLLFWIQNLIHFLSIFS